MQNSPDLKGSSFILSVLHLSDNNIKNAVEFVKDKVAQAPLFLSGAPIVLNVSQVEGDIDFLALKKGIQNVGMISVGITGCDDEKKQRLAAKAGFAIMNGGKSTSIKQTSNHNQAESNHVVTTSKPAQIIRTPIRSGQQVYAKDCDLIILNHVSTGAEVIADGSIDIHGALRGRAIAGASGQQDAKIICQDLQAELVSIAGTYWLSEQIQSEFWQKKVIVNLNDESLNIEVLDV